MGNLSEKEQIVQYIARASTEELLCIAAIIMTCKADMLKGHKCPDMKATRGAYKRAIKRMRSAQASHPEEREELEGAIQFIRREWLHKEV